VVADEVEALYEAAGSLEWIFKHDDDPGPGHLCHLVALKLKKIAASLEKRETASKKKTAN